jgi:hypothetical protein
MEEVVDRTKPVVRILITDSTSTVGPILTHCLQDLFFNIQASLTRVGQKLERAA